MTDFWKNDQPADAGTNFWEKDQKVDPSASDYAADAAKATPTGLEQGVVGLAGLGGDLSELGKAAAGKVSGWLPDIKKPGWLDTWGKYVAEEQRSHPSPAYEVGHGDLPGSYEPPTSAQLQGSVEGATGPLYQAQYGPGKAAQTAGQILPSLATGGGTIPGVVAKAVGGGVTSELSGEAANKLKGYLPQSWQPWAEPVARAVGTVPGMAAPATARRARTLLPVTDQRLATINALRQTNPELIDATSAGKLTESPRVMAVEARSPAMRNQLQEQNEAYTRGLMRQAGSNGMFDTAGLAEARQTGAQLEALRNAHRMSPGEFASLNTDVNAIGRPGSPLYRAVGPSQPFQDVRNAIRQGPNPTGPTPLDMTGQRYGALKQITQTAADAAPTSHKQVAILAARDRLNQAFHNSMPPDEAARLQGLDQQYSNYKTIEGIPAKVGENTVTPQQVSSRATRGSPLDVHAEQASSMMTPHPTPSNAVPAWADLLSSLGSGALAGIGSHAAGAGGYLSAGIGTETGVLGHLLAPSLYNGAKDVAGRVVASPWIQRYLKNQAWRPGPNTSAPDRDLLLRLLMTPPVKAIGSNNSSQ